MMTVEEFRKAMAGTEYVPAGRALHLAFHEFSQEALKITAELNGRYNVAGVPARVIREI